LAGGTGGEILYIVDKQLLDIKKMKSEIYEKIWRLTSDFQRF
jgi:hypothetical protein